jgi:hypothetical protein
VVAKLPIGNYNTKRDFKQERLTVKFERFDKRQTPIAGSPFATIQRGGRVMTINRVAHEMLGSPEAVELLFNEENRVIGIRQVSKTEPYAFPLRGQSRKGHEPSNYVVAMQAFTKHYGIDTSVAMRYPAEMQDDVLTIPLDRGTVATGPRLQGDAAKA